MGHTSNSLVILPFSVQISRESFEMEEEMKQEEAEQVPSTSKDENAKEVTKYRLNRSLSLRSIEQDPPKEDTNPKKGRILHLQRGLSVSRKQRPNLTNWLISIRVK